MKLRDSWSNAILHLTAFINRKKEELLTQHGLSGLFLVLTIMGAEILLLFVSLPSYLAASPTSLEGQVQEYRLRRALTLGVFLTLFIIWIVKLSLILILTWHSNSRGAVSVKEVDNSSEETEIDTAAHDMLVASIEPGLLPPEIYEVDSTHKSITIKGKTTPLDGVIFVFSEDVKNEGESLQPKIYTAWADKEGNFALLEDSNVFNLNKGAYDVSAITYDPDAKSKSENAREFKVEVEGTLAQSILSSMDTILNIAALLAIIAGFLLTLLVT